MVLVGAAALLRGEASVRQEGETIFAGNGEVELRFHRPSGRWTGLIDVASGYDFVVVPNYWGTPFNLAVRVDGQMEYPSAGSASTSSFESERTGTGLLLRFGYSGFRMVSGRVLDMGVRYTVEIPDAGLLTYWRISVDNREELPVESVGFPTIVGLGAIGADPRQEYLAYPIMSGTLYRDPLHNLPVGRGVLAQYPSSFATMQFAAYYSAERKLGLYLAAYDTDAYIKELQILKPSEEYLLATCFRALEQGPRNSYESSYPVVVGPFRGEWFDAANMYREWALQQEWVKKEPAPEWFPKVNIYQWLYTLPFGYDAKPFRVVPDVAKDTAAQMGSPSAITWIGWERVGWYSYWPDVFPPKEGWESFDRSVAGTHEAGDRIFLIADVGGQSSVASNWEEAKPWAVRQPDGSLALWPYSEATARETATISTTFATMCPATAYWQAKLGEVLGTLAAHGADIVQLDGFPVNQPLLCMDASHGHPLGGGNWWTKGYLDAFRRAKSAAGEAGTPLLYSAEGGGGAVSSGAGFLLGSVHHGAAGGDHGGIPEAGRCRADPAVEHGLSRVCGGAGGVDAICGDEQGTTESAVLRAGDGVGPGVGRGSGNVAPGQADVGTDGHGGAGADRISATDCGGAVDVRGTVPGAWADAAASEAGRAVVRDRGDGPDSLYGVEVSGVSGAGGAGEVRGRQPTGTSGWWPRTSARSG